MDKESENPMTMAWISARGWAAGFRPCSVVHLTKECNGVNMPICNQHKKGGRPLGDVTRGENVLEAGNQGRHICLACLRETPKEVVELLREHTPEHMIRW